VSDNHSVDMSLMDNFTNFDGLTEIAVFDNGLDYDDSPLGEI